MIDKLLKHFIREIKTDQALLQETAFAALMGDHEEYFQRKFAYSIRNSPNILPKDTVAIESKSCDLVFYRTSSKTIHFVELKAMTLPIRTQRGATFKRKKKELETQLTEKYNLSTQPKRSLWALFVFTDFNDEFKNSYIPKDQNEEDWFIFNGLFQKHKPSNVSKRYSERNYHEIFRNQKLNWIELPLDKRFNPEAELRIAFLLDQWSFNSLTQVAEPSQQIIQLLGNIDCKLDGN
jgi:hypothetical protein